MCPHYGESVYIAVGGHDEPSYQSVDGERVIQKRWQSFKEGCTGGRGMFIVEFGVHHSPSYAASYAEQQAQSVRNELEAVRSFHAERGSGAWHLMQSGRRRSGSWLRSSPS